VKSIVSSSDEVSETGGVRMAAERAGTQANFHLSVVPLPAEDDEVIEEQGVRVFLEPEAASLLDEKVLDASVEQDRVASRSPTRSRNSRRLRLARRGRARAGCSLRARSQGVHPAANATCRFTHREARETRRELEPMRAEYSVRRKRLLRRLII
jgi:hypothetical protein